MKRFFNHVLGALTIIVGLYFLAMTSLPAATMMFGQRFQTVVVSSQYDSLYSNKGGRSYDRTIRFEVPPAYCTGSLAERACMHEVLVTSYQSESALDGYAQGSKITVAAPLFDGGNPEPLYPRPIAATVLAAPLYSLAAVLIAISVVYSPHMRRMLTRKYPEAVENDRRPAIARAAQRTGYVGIGLGLTTFMIHAFFGSFGTAVAFVFPVVIILLVLGALYLRKLKATPQE